MNSRPSTSSRLDVGLRRTGRRRSGFVKFDEDGGGAVLVTTCRGDATTASSPLFVGQASQPAGRGPAKNFTAQAGMPAPEKLIAVSRDNPASGSRDVWLECCALDLFLGF